MGIDVRELRIGNHVMWNGERVRIDEISIGGVVGCILQDGSDWFGYNADKLDPIPITEELLIELGFEKNNTDLDLDYEKFPKDGLGIFIKGVKENLIRVEIWDNVIKKGNMLCQYLHELETFVFMTTKKELLK